MNMNDSMQADAGVIVLFGEPFPEITLEIAEEMCRTANCESEIVTAFAVVENEFWWYDDITYDYELGISEYNHSRKICGAWGKLAENMKNIIFDILRKEGVIISVTCQITVLVPFMERNGYKDGNGWWIKKSE